MRNKIDKNLVINDLETSTIQPPLISSYPDQDLVLAPAPPPETMVEIEMKVTNKFRTECYDNFQDFSYFCLKTFCGICCDLDRDVCAADNQDSCIPFKCNAEEFFTPLGCDDGEEDNALFATCMWLGSICCLPILIPASAIACVAKNTCCFFCCKDTERAMVPASKAHEYQQLN